MKMLYILETEQFSSEECRVFLDLRVVPPLRKLL
jgi:hypothetical protein